MAQSVILVVGATGNVGRQVVSQLLPTGAAVRALARDPAAAGLRARSTACAPTSRTRTRCMRAWRGPRRCFWSGPFLRPTARPRFWMRSPGTRAAWSTCHRSAYETTRNGIDPINQLHADIERLIERTGLAWTFLRASGFATNALWWAPQIRADGVVRGPYGAAVRSSIHERDIAAGAVRALTGDGHAGAQHLLTGPKR